MVKSPNGDPGSRGRASGQSPISGFVDLHKKRARIDWDEAKRLYVDQKLSFAEVARRLYYSVKCVRDGILERGVTSRRNDESDNEASVRLRTQWRLMRRRCLDPTYGAYEHYGARGVIVCGEWDDFRLFCAWALAQGFEPGVSVVQKDRSGDFSPENCAVVSREKAIARRFEDLPPGAHREIETFGESKGLVAWSKDPRCRVSFATLSRRLAGGVPPETAITDPSDRTRTLPRSTDSTGTPDTTGQNRPHVDWLAARRLYQDQSLSLDEIAIKLGCSATGIRAAFKRNGVELRPRPIYSTTTGNGLRMYQVWANLRYRRRVERGEKATKFNVPEPEVAWPKYEAFRDWLGESGWRPGLCVVRNDDSKPYSAENCRLVTRKEMARTRRPASKPPDPIVIVTAFGETKGISAWARDPRCRVTLASLRNRLRGGIHPEDAIAAEPQTDAMTGVYRRMLTAFGETKSLTEWSKDPRCRLTLGGLSGRLARGLTMEQALTEKPFRGYEIDSSRHVSPKV